MSHHTTFQMLCVYNSVHDVRMNTRINNINRIKYKQVMEKNCKNIITKIIIKKNIHNIQNYR